MSALGLGEAFSVVFAYYLFCAGWFFGVDVSGFRAEALKCAFLAGLCVSLSAGSVAVSLWLQGHLRATFWVVVADVLLAVVFALEIALHSGPLLLRSLRRELKRPKARKRRRSPPRPFHAKRYERSPPTSEKKI